jgi:tellurite resistance protein TerC
MRLVHEAIREVSMHWLWIVFTVFVLAMLALDLAVFHRKAHVVQMKEALVWSGVWIGLALVFNVLVYFGYEYHWLGMDIPGSEPDGWTAAVMFFTGYVVEKSLSVDNVFVIAMVFSYFGVPAVSQHRVLFWGIFGALLMRAAMILLGSVLIAKFHWILYLFGTFLILTAAKMLLTRREPDPKNTWLVRLARRLFPITDDFVGEHFGVRIDGKWMLTPLALALVAVESTDLMFAVDSVPAIFALTQDPFLVFSSNVFAMLGLRSLYLALAGIMDRFYYLKLSLIVLLILIGVKMLLKDVLHEVPGLTYYTLGAIAVILATGVLASIVRARQLHVKTEEGALDAEREPAQIGVRRDAAP